MAGMIKSIFGLTTEDVIQKEKDFKYKELPYSSHFSQILRLIELT